MANPKNTLNFELAWSQCLDIIKDNIPLNAYKKWFEGTQAISLADNVLTIRVESHYHYEHLEAHYIDLIRKAIRRIYGQGTKLQYSAMLDKRDSLGMKIPATNTELIKNPIVEIPPTEAQNMNPWVRAGIPSTTRIKSNLNPRCTFDNFIEGDCNKLARTCGIKIALEPGTTPFNPMFVHSGTGLGKTHLLHAIGMLTKENHSSLNVLYTNWEDFTRQWVEASKSNTSIVEFQNFYHSIDVLLIDDINRVHGRNATQEAFFNVFNDLHQRNKQIVMASDRSPADLEGLESRLLSRFKWGLIDQLIMPDIETRIKIIKQKMIDNGVMSIPESVIENIAYSATSNVRELEGVLNSILAHSIMLKDSSQITAEFANSIIDKFIRNSSKEISMDYIKNVICDFLKVPPSDINSKARKSNIVKARQLIMYFAKLHTKASLEQIGRQCGDKNHATVIHAIKTVTNLAETEHAFKKTVDELENKLTVYGTANFDTKLHR